MPRRTIIQRPDGRWAARYHGKWFYSRISQSDLFEKMALYREQERLGLAGDESLIGYKKTFLKTLTGSNTADYERVLNRLIFTLGNVKLSAVTPTMCQLFINQYSGMSSSCIHFAGVALRRFFRCAVSDRLIVHNPALGIKPPKGEAGTHRAITEEEKQLILSTPHQMRLFALTMLYSGLRRGEVLALTDADITDREIIVRKAVKFVRNRPVVKAPKTFSGRREVPLFEPLKDEIRNHKGLIFSRNGQIPSQTSFRENWESYLSALSRAAGKPVSIRTHDLRHTFCTMCFDADVDVKTCAAWMGHADIQMVLRVYAHLSEQHKAEQAEKVIAFVQRKAEEE